MSLKDRGLKKWTAFMLPEHVEMMKEFDRDDFVRKPIIDEDMIQEFESRIQYATESRCRIVFTLWHEGFTEEICGYIHRLDPISKEIWIKDEVGRVRRIKFEDIIDVQVAE